ncbi:MAG: hypothetical protein ABIC18_04520 [Candidatus Omnitrophota bacterium]
MKLKGSEFYLSKKVGRAITDYGMFCEGDRKSGSRFPGARIA